MRAAFRSAASQGRARIIACAATAAVIQGSLIDVSRRDTHAAAAVALPNAVQQTDNAVVRKGNDKLTESFARQVYWVVVKLEQVIRYLSRFLQVGALASPLLALAPATYLLGSTSVGGNMESLTMDYICWALEVLGPAFIKLAQWASSRPDLYPPVVIDKLSKFQDDVRIKYSSQVVDKTLSDAFGANWKERLSVDMDNPIGSGCIAQVFRGILREAGQQVKVAIKIIHPHVESMIKTDMEILSGFATLVDLVPALEMLSFGESCRQFGKAMNDQLDMTIEAKNLVKFASKWGNEKWASFPRPIEGYVKRNVLVETLMEGQSIVNFMALRDELGEKTRKLKALLSDLGARAMIKMIFFDNFIHGDMHPGNILVDFDPHTGEPHLVFLDCGIVYYSKTEKEHSALVDICIAFMQHDGRRAARLMIDNNSGANRVHNAQGFIEAVQLMVDDAEHHSYFEHLGEYVVRICELARVHRVRLDPGYFHVAMALKVAEGISLALDKDLDLVSKCIPVIMKARALKAMGRDVLFDPDADKDKGAEAKK